MSNWKTACKWIGIISLLFLAVPIRIKNPHENEKSVALFQEYMNSYNKSYIQGSDEYNKRFKIFKDTLKAVDTLNDQRTHNQSALYGVTEFFDLTEDEFISRHLDDMKRLRKLNKLNKFLLGLADKDPPSDAGVTLKSGFVVDKGIPLKVDWREKGVISEVANQGLCGACWAYSVIEVIEAMAAKQNGNLTKLSVQEMIDCASNGNFGCKGGDICNLLYWIKNNNISILPANEYPTTGTYGECLYTKKNVSSKVVKVKDYTCENFIDNERKLISTLATQGPVAVAINALTWQYYLGGVIQYHCPGDDNQLNHAVQIVGYDLTGDIPYYIAKNSWGKAFGIDGYIHIAVGGNICGVAVEVSSLNIA